MSYLKRHAHAARAAGARRCRARCRTAPAASPGRSTTGRGCAASSSSAPRAAATTRREWKLTRENAQAVERCLGGDGPRTVARDRARSATRAARRRTIRRIFALAMAAGLGDDGDAQGRARRAAAGVPHGHAPVPVRDVRRGLPRLGPLAAARGRRAGTRRSRSDALAYQAVKYRQREGVTHRDLLRLAHPARARRRRQPDARACRDEHARLFEWIVRGGETDGLPRLDRGLRARAGGARRRPRRPRWSASTACRARRCRPST